MPVALIAVSPPPGVASRHPTASRLEAVTGLLTARPASVASCCRRSGDGPGRRRRCGQRGGDTSIAAVAVQPLEAAAVGAVAEARRDHRTGSSTAKRRALGPTSTPPAPEQRTTKVRGPPRCLRSPTEADQALDRQVPRER